MARVSIYLNFMGNTEEVFNYYKSVFGTEFLMPPMHMGDMPMPEGAPPLSEKDKNAIMHVSLPILGGTLIMGTDILESMGHQLKEGNNVTISLEADSNEDADRLFAALSAGGSEIEAMRNEFWGYWGCAKDRFGVRWMFNVMQPQQ